MRYDPATKTLHVKSAGHWYVEEMSGRKPNTLRFCDDNDLDCFPEERIEHIEVHCDGCSFTRDNIRIFKCGEMLGKTLVEICWDHPKEDE